ncbi:MAG: HAD family phosphatase [Ignavibacteria bacterium]|nr:HAD family phosphatase [Ignavibacteria bacterium]
MKRARITLFDLGNVLVDIHPVAFTRRLGIDDNRANDVYREGIVSLVWRYESGTMTTEEYLNGLDALFDSRYSFDELRQAMLAVIGEPVEGMEAIVREVNKRMPIALVSNTNELHFNHSLERVPAVRLMSNYFLSYQLRAMKPDPLYYLHVLNGVAADPAEVVFIDDLKENVDGASQAGMQGVHFTSVESLSGNLRRCGVL